VKATLHLTAGQLCELIISALALRGIGAKEVDFDYDPDIGVSANVDVELAARPVTTYRDDR
jgi:hypothetical protein